MGDNYHEDIKNVASKVYQLRICDNWNNYSPNATKRTIARHEIHMLCAR